MAPIAPQQTVGGLIREWRMHHHLSQEELALRSELSQRHLSFLENGRSQPSRRTIVRLATALDLPLRHRNDLLLAAGYAPMYAERTIDDPQLASIRETLELILNGHEPYPAFVINRNYDVIAANRSVEVFVEDLPPHLLSPRLNVVRACLHPEGLAPRLLNFETVHANLLARLHRDLAATGSTSARELIAEISQYPGPDPSHDPLSGPLDIATSLRLRTSRGELAFHATIATFSTAFDITVAEFAIESFFPADAATAAALRATIGPTSQPSPPLAAMASQGDGRPLV
ncbi:helix-turn-helix transcriptional regulator [Nocardia sp. NPDC049707]|uniref:helix-turn-helix domain-containing protein n=1 Tax=Nocardia sp. NPDC049707 TaxID=3154735 RepID=UPI00343B061C